MAEATAPPARWASSPRTSVMSLSRLSQVKVLRVLHARAASMEINFMDKWHDQQLSEENRQLAQTVNVCGPNIDTAAVVSQYETDRKTRVRLLNEAAEKAAARELMAATKKKGGARDCSVDLLQLRREIRSSSKRMVTARMSTGGNKYLRKRPVYKSFRSKPTFKDGVEVGVEPRQYIEYRKCKYLEDIAATRKYLLQVLAPEALNDLMDTLQNMAKFNDGHEHSLLTLQAMLTSSAITDFRIAPAKLYLNFSLKRMYPPVPLAEQLQRLENRVGTSILHYALREAIHLTRLDLTRCASDSILKVVSQTAGSSLKYLDISGSVVSDRGLLYLCGLEVKGAVRPVLQRRCKTTAGGGGRDPARLTRSRLTYEDGSLDGIVTNRSPRWARTLPGCLALQHLHANGLQLLRWAGPTSPLKLNSVPIDCGFVAALVHMPNLRTLFTENGARSVDAYKKLHVKLRKAAPALSLESLSDTQMSAPLLKTVRELCPRLRNLKVEWRPFFSSGSGATQEDWLEEAQLLPGLSVIHTKGIDFRTPRLAAALDAGMGSNLTVLNLRELTRFRYSMFIGIKQACQNLVYFSCAMTMKRVIPSLTQIQVIKDDSNITVLKDSKKSGFSQLEEFHLSGPFGSDFVKFLLYGADGLRSLSLAIEWPEPPFCDPQPQGARDFLGMEYMQEILRLNNLKNLQEMHLLSQCDRGRKYLDRPFASFILDSFPNVSHFGSFQYWGLCSSVVNSIIAEARSVNRDITFDEDLQADTRGVDRPEFEFKYVSGRQSMACRDLVPKKESLLEGLGTGAGGLLIALNEDFFQQLGNIGFIAGGIIDQGDLSDDDGSEASDSDDEHQACVIM